MAIYFVQARGSDSSALEKARFVRQGFSWPAFFFSWLWLLYHRCWLALFVFLAGEIAFILFAVPHLAPGASIAIDLLVRVLLGLEGNHLRLARNAPVNDVVEARDRDEAEIVFFRRVLGDA